MSKAEPVDTSNLTKTQKLELFLERPLYQAIVIAFQNTSIDSRIEYEFFGGFAQYSRCCWRLRYPQNAGMLPQNRVRALLIIAVSYLPGH